MTTLPQFVTVNEETGERYRSDQLDHSREILRVCHPDDDGEPAEEALADVIADMLHLAAASGVLIDDVLEHGRRYYEYDLEGPLL